MIRLIAALLLLWEPLNFAVEALTVLPSITYRGWQAAIELTCHGMVAALAASGALALWNGTANAATLSIIAIIASTARTIQSAYWSALPTATSPGDEHLIAGVAVLVGATALWVVRARGI